MSGFKEALNNYLTNELESRPSWDRQIPDEIFAEVESVDDLLDFVEFAAANIDGDLLEYGCYETDRFLAQIVSMYRDEANKEHAGKMGIETDFGFLAYVLVLAMGNE